MAEQSPTTYADLARSIRRFALWGPWGIGVVLVALVVGEVGAMRNGMPAVNAIPGLTTAFFTNVMALFMLWFLRPRMLANAERIAHWDVEAAERERTEKLEHIHDVLAAYRDYRAITEDLLRIERELEGD